MQYFMLAVQNLALGGLQNIYFYHLSHKSWFPHLQSDLTTTGRSREITCHIFHRLYQNTVIPWPTKLI